MKSNVICCLLFFFYTELSGTPSSEGITDWPAQLTRSSHLKEKPVWSWRGLESESKQGNSSQGEKMFTDLVLSDVCFTLKLNYWYKWGPLTFCTNLFKTSGSIKVYVMTDSWTWWVASLGTACNSSFEKNRVTGPNLTYDFKDARIMLKRSWQCPPQKMLKRTVVFFWDLV